MSTDSSLSCDVAVVGAGPAGSAAARRLAGRGCRVVLIERTRFDQPRVGESLAPAVRPLLDDLGVWRQFLALDPVPSHGTRSLWGSVGAEEHSHLFSPYGSGWHVDRRAFDRMLAESAAAAGAELKCGTVLVGCQAADGDRWCLRLRSSGGGAAEHPVELSARVVIDATGRAARLGRRLGARRVMFDRLVGVAALFGGVDVAREGFILLEASAQGWWYSAPVPEDGLMTMVMTDSDLCRRAGLSAPSRWRQGLAGAPATSARLAGPPSAASISSPMLWGPRIFSAVSQRLCRSELTGDWLAVGDASLAVDPISGSGVVRALRSAQAGADAVLALLDDRSSRALEAYEADRDLECDSYLQQRGRYYGIERRWQESTFWRRRDTMRLPASPAP